MLLREGQSPLSKQQIMKHNRRERDGSRDRPWGLCLLALELLGHGCRRTNFGSSVGPDGSDEEGRLHFEELGVGEEVLEVRADCERQAGRVSYTVPRARSFSSTPALRSLQNTPY